MFKILNSKKRAVVLCVILAVATLIVSGCSKGEKRYEATFLEVFDTVTTIKGYAKDEETFKKISNEIRDELEEYHKLYDIYNDYKGINNIKTINDNAGKAPVKVDKRIIDLILFAKEEDKRTNGKVNIAFGSVLSKWHDAREAGIDDPENAYLPDMNQLKEAAKHTNIDDVIVDEANSTVFLKDENMSLDVGAVAKGYATERVAENIEKKGYSHISMSVGGNIRTIGGKFDDSGKEVAWKIGIQNPIKDDEKSTLVTLNCKDYSIVTSGVYERYYTVNGKRYHHIIDPNTLMPSEDYLSVSIICKDGGLADCLSTAVFNMPIEEGKKYIESLDGVEAMWVLKDNTQVMSSGFSKYVAE